MTETTPIENAALVSRTFSSRSWCPLCTLTSAVCEKLIQDKSDLAAVQGPTCITQLPASSFREEGCFCSQLTLIALGKGVSGLSFCSEMWNKRGNLKKRLHKAVVVPTLDKMFEHQPFYFCIRQPDVVYKKLVVIFPPTFFKRTIFWRFYFV